MRDFLQVLCGSNPFMIDCVVNIVNIVDTCTLCHFSDRYHGKQQRHLVTHTIYIIHTHTY